MFYMSGDREHDREYGRIQSWVSKSAVDFGWVATSIQPIEDRTEDPYLGAEGDDNENEGSSSDEDDDEEVGTHQHDGRTSEEALM